MTDFFADRIKLYPNLGTPSTMPTGGSAGGDGTAESGKGSGMEAELVKIGSLGKTRNAPREFESPVAGTGYENDTEVELNP